MMKKKIVAEMDALKSLATEPHVWNQKDMDK